MDSDKATDVLAELHERIAAEIGTSHRWTPYFAAQVEIVELLIRGIQEDMARDEAFFTQEVALQQEECAALLESLAHNMDLCRRSRELAAETAHPTVDVRNFGAVGDGDHDDGPALRRAIVAAAESGPGARVLIPGGRYVLGDLDPGERRCHLLLEDLEDLSLIGEDDTMLVMTQVAPGIIVQGGHNVEIINLGIDFDPLPFTQGTILDVDVEANTFDVEIDAGYPDPQAAYFQDARIPRGTVRDPERGTIDLATRDLRVRRVDALESRRYRFYAEDNQQRVRSGLVEGYRAGARYEFHARDPEGGGSALELHGARYATLDRVHIHASFSHAFLLTYCTGVKLIECEVKPLPGNDRIASINADGFHCRSNYQGPWLKDCHFTHLNDDDVNIYGKSFALAASDAPDTYILDQVVPGPRGEGQDVHPFRKGDAVVFMDTHSGEFVAHARVTKIDTAHWEGKTNLRIHLDRPIEDLITRQALGKGPQCRREYVWAEAETPIEHFVTNLNAKGNGFVIQDCDFGDHRALCAKIKGTNGLIENNTMGQVQGPCVLLASRQNWLEAYPPRNVVIRNNTFDNFAGMASTYDMPGRPNPGPRLIRRIRIRDNAFENASYYGITLRSAQDVVIAGNRFISPHPVILENCTEVRVRDNVFEGVSEESVEVSTCSDVETIECQ